MADILIAYGTTEGHTRDIVEHITEQIEAAGHRVNTIDCGAPTGLPEHFDALLVGASVHQAHHQSSVTAFVLEHRERFESLPGAFFSVSLAAALPDEIGSAEAQGYIDAFVDETGWRPRLTTSFAGALRHDRYDYLRVLLLRQLARQLGHGVVTAADAVYTDWAEVDAFVLRFLDDALGAAPRARHDHRASERSLG